MTPVIRQLLIANAVVFGLQQVVADGLITHFALWPLGHHFVPDLGSVGFEPWQLVTSAFLHGGVAHIAFNMFALFSFGSVVERAVGSRRFAWLYFVSVLSASLVQLLVVTAMVEHGVAPTVGRLGRCVRGLAGVRVSLPTRESHADISSDSHEGLDAGDGLRARRAHQRSVWHGAGRRALRAPRRNAGSCGRVVALATARHARVVNCETWGLPGLTTSLAARKGNDPRR